MDSIDFPVAPDWLALPPEILSLIFTMMTVVDRFCRVTGVCRYWRAIAMENFDLSCINLTTTRRSLLLTTSTRATSRSLLRSAFKRAVKLGTNTVTTFSFDSGCHVTNRQLRYAYRRLLCNYFEIPSPIKIYHIFHSFIGLIWVFHAIVQVSEFGRTISSIFRDFDLYRIQESMSLLD